MGSTHLCGMRGNLFLVEHFGSIEFMSNGRDQRLLGRDMEFALLDMSVSFVIVPPHEV